MKSLSTLRILQILTTLRAKYKIHSPIQNNKIISSPLFHPRNNQNKLKMIATAQTTAAYSLPMTISFYSASV